jgi:O-antigen/teichoic acid export membrane protein
MALLRHSGIYFLARIVAGAAGFAIIAAYTRLLSAQEFGELALALTGVGFFALLILEGPTCRATPWRRAPPYCGV